jgi:NAD-dependent SIR2 family protein deacetylase
MPDDDVIKAHEHSSKHRNEIMESNLCGCFYCLETFTPQYIVEWIDDGECAMCPKCGIDSVIGDRSGFPIEKAFLEAMRNHWFGKTD